VVWWGGCGGGGGGAARQDDDDGGGGGGGGWFWVARLLMWTVWYVTLWSRKEKIWIESSLSEVVERSSTT